MNLYFEINDCYVKQYGFKFCVADNARLRKWPASIVMEISDRVWKEDGKEVRFIKNRYSYCGHVDMKEFMWVKLQSKLI